MNQVQKVRLVVNFVIIALTNSKLTVTTIEYIIYADFDQATKTIRLLPCIYFSFIVLCRSNNNSVTEQLITKLL